MSLISVFIITTLYECQIFKSTDQWICYCSILCVNFVINPYFYYIQIDNISCINDNKLIIIISHPINNDYFIAIWRVVTLQRGYCYTLND